MDDHAQNRKVPFSDKCEPTGQGVIPSGASQSETLAAELFRAAGEGDLTLVCFAPLVRQFRDALR